MCLVHDTSFIQDHMEYQLLRCASFPPYYINNMGCATKVGSRSDMYHTYAMIQQPRQYHIISKRNNTINNSLKRINLRILEKYEASEREISMG